MAIAVFVFFIKSEQVFLIFIIIYSYNSMERERYYASENSITTEWSSKCN